MGKEINGPRKEIVSLKKRINRNHNHLEEAAKKWSSKPITFNDLSKASYVIITINKNGYDTIHKCKLQNCYENNFNDIENLVRSQNLVSINESIEKFYIRRKSLWINMKYEKQMAKSGDNILINVKKGIETKKRIVKFKIIRITKKI